MSKLYQYLNGNVGVTIKDDGTSIREYIGEAKPEFPCSIDVKITNFCDLGNYCLWCHEKSNLTGKHADIDELLECLGALPPGVELAIGGGNPLAHPELERFLGALKQRGIIANMTVNELHLKKYEDVIERLLEDKLIWGLGISYSGKHKDLVKKFVEMTSNTVLHVIAGINPIECLDEVLEMKAKILVLGYKQFGKGERYYSKKVEENKYQWYTKMPLYFKKIIFSFDNLAIDQLNLKRFLPKESWDQFFMGDEGEFSMYICGVEKEYAVSSTHKRHRIGGAGVKELFTKVNKKRHE